VLEVDRHGDAEPTAGGIGIGMQLCYDDEGRFGKILPKELSVGVEKGRRSQSRIGLGSGAWRSERSEVRSRAPIQAIGNCRREADVPDYR
jgi:hypothetical protein